MHFLEGIADYLDGKVSNISETSREIISYDQEILSEHDINYQYCCEVLLIGKDIDTESLKQVVEPLGDSIVVAGSKEKVRIHIHSNTPAKVFMELRNFGKISQQKVDDMRMEHQVNHHRKHSIALVTDSIADLPLSYIENKQIQIIPLNIDIEGSVFIDKIGINNEILFSIIDDLKVFPTSFQASLNFVKQKLDFLKDKYDSIIIISVSAEMSGTWNVFNTATEELQSEGKKISLVNSCLNSGAQGLLVMEAAEMIEKALSHEEIVKNIEKIKKIVIDIQKTKKVRKYSIVHGNDMERAEEYREVFKKLIGQEPEYIQEISSIVALSAGKNSVALCLIEE